MARFTLSNVRLSFPHVFKKAQYDGKETKFESTVLIPKDDKEQLAKIDKATDAALLETFGSKDKIPKGIKKGVRNCLRDGDDVDYDGYAGHMSFKAANNKRPRTIDRDKTVISEDDGKLYAGCYCDVIVDIWIQNNAYGTRVNANLMALRHRKDGEPFGAGSIPDGVEDDFEELESDELDDDEMEDF